jgi:succinate dehydrogenase/fumarate reductase flavoprotein subunit
VDHFYVDDRKQYKLQRRQNLPVITIESKVLEKEHKKLQEAREVLNNIPILQGSKSFLWQALKSLSLA